MKTYLSLILTLFIGLYTFAQKPKKTHDYEAFAKKAVKSMAYIDKMCPDRTAIKYLSEQSGIPFEELRTRQKANLASLNEDIQFIMNNGIYGKMKTIELTNVRESPVKMADIVVNYTNKTGSFQFVLKNCVQTNISWYMGDRILAEGEGVEGIISKRAERKENAESGLFGKLKELDEMQDSLQDVSKEMQAQKDSLNATRAGYLGTTFPMKGIDKSTKYYNYEWTDMPLKGYYVTTDGTIVDAVIAYRKPEFMVGSIAGGLDLYICHEANNKKLDVFNIDKEPNFKAFISKTGLQGFYVGGTYFANIPKVGWRILLSEGAIREFVNIEKVVSGESVKYLAFKQTQKLNEKPIGSVLSGASRNVILDMLADSPEIQEAYKDNTYEQFEAIIRFNYWFDLEFPEKVKYFTTK